MEQDLKEFIIKELKYSWHPRYYKYIDTYINNITEHQLLYWKAWMSGKMSMY